MNTQTLILAILTAGDASGYEIKKFSSEGSFSHFVDISFGSIYPTLAKLEADGLVTGRSETQSGKPDKIVYSITDAGRAAFIGALSSPPQADKFKSEFLLVAMCAGMLTREVLNQAMALRLKDLESKLEMIRKTRDDCDQPATKWVTDYGEHVMLADLAYLRKNWNSLLALAGDAAKAEAAE